MAMSSLIKCRPKYSFGTDPTRMDVRMHCKTCSTMAVGEGVPSVGGKSFARIGKSALCSATVSTLSVESQRRKAPKNVLISGLSSDPLEITWRQSEGETSVRGRMESCYQRASPGYFIETIPQLFHRRFETGMADEISKSIHEKMKVELKLTLRHPVSHR